MTAPKTSMETMQADALQAIVADLIANYGEPSRDDQAWAKRVLSAVANRHRARSKQ